MDMPRLIEIENGAPAAGTFSDNEYERRLAKLRAHMAEAGVEACLFTVPELRGFEKFAEGRPIEEIFDGPVRNQYGLEAYWRILLSPHIWITPGVQLIWDPSFNPMTDFLAIPQIKFRLFL